MRRRASKRRSRRPSQTKRYMRTRKKLGNRTRHRHRNRHSKGRKKTGSSYVKRRRRALTGGMNQPPALPPLHARRQVRSKQAVRGEREREKFRLQPAPARHPHQGRPHPLIKLANSLCEKYSTATPTAPPFVTYTMLEAVMLLHYAFVHKTRDKSKDTGVHCETVKTKIESGLEKLTDQISRFRGGNTNWIAPNVRTDMKKGAVAAFTGVGMMAFIAATGGVGSLPLLAFIFATSTNFSLPILGSLYTEFKSGTTTNYDMALLAMVYPVKSLRESFINHTKNVARFVINKLETEVVELELNKNEILFKQQEIRSKMKILRIPDETFIMPSDLSELQDELVKLSEMQATLNTHSPSEHASSNYVPTRQLYDVCSCVATWVAEAYPGAENTIVDIGDQLAMLCSAVHLELSRIGNLQVEIRANTENISRNTDELEKLKRKIDPLGDDGNLAAAQQAIDQGLELVPESTELLDLSSPRTHLNLSPKPAQSPRSHHDIESNTYRQNPDSLGTSLGRSPRSAQSPRSLLDLSPKSTTSND